MTLKKVLTKKRKVIAQVIMCKIDFAIKKNAYDLLEESGITDEEASFLLGKRNKYFIEIFDPTSKNKFKTEQLGILPFVLQQPINKIVPNDITGSEKIKIKATKVVHPDKIVFEYSITDEYNITAAPVKIVKTVIQGERRELQEDVHSQMLMLIHAGYFSDPVSAIKLYLFYVKNFRHPFKVVDVQKSLYTLLRKDRQVPLISRIIVDTRYYYVANG